MEKYNRRSTTLEVRVELWKYFFNNSLYGKCYCCGDIIEAGKLWHAGYIISDKNGDISNLRPLCISCNLCMGSENMDDFKSRCFN